jgi:hypothetical protein
VALAVWWAPRQGAYGVALATLLGDVLCGLLVYPRLANRFLGAAAGCVERTILSTLAVLAPLFGGSWLIARFAHNWWGVVAFAAMVAAWAVPAAYLTLGAEGLGLIRSSLEGRLAVCGLIGRLRASGRRWRAAGKAEPLPTETMVGP